MCLFPPVAQLVRASSLYLEGLWFESRRADKVWYTVLIISSHIFVMKLTPPKQLLIQSWATFKKTWKVLVRIVALVAAPTFVLVAMIMGIALSGYTTVAIILGLILVMLAVYFFSWAYSAIIYVLSNSHEEHRTTARKAFVHTKARVWVMIGVGILISLIVMGGLILLIIPGIIFSVWYGMSRYIVITENLSVIESLKKSRSYVDGYFWPIIIRMLVIVALGIGVTVVVEILAAVISFGSTIIADVINMLASAVWSLFTVVYGYRVYATLKQAHSEEV
jgi:hypothetical protein